MFKATNTYDIVFKTSDGGRVGAHKTVLTAASPVFHPMLKDKTEIELPAYTSAVITLLLTFVYTGVMDAHDDDDLCISLLQAAHFFGLQQLEELCTDAVSIDVDNYCHVATMSLEQNLSGLYQQCHTFMEENGSKIVNMPAFTHLPLTAMNNLLRSDVLEVKEVQLFLAVLGWSIQQLRNVVTDDRIQKAMGMIRYPLMELRDLKEVVQPTHSFDNELFKAAVRYRESGIYDGPPTQLIVRGYHFYFGETVGDFLVTYTAKGAVISRQQIYGGDSIRCDAWCACTDVFGQHVMFKLVVTKTDTGKSIKSSVSLEVSVHPHPYLGWDDQKVIRVSSLPYGDEINGEIVVKREEGEEVVEVKVGTTTSVKHYNAKSVAMVYIDILMGRKGDEAIITRL